MSTRRRRAETDRAALSAQGKLAGSCAGCQLLQWQTPRLRSIGAREEQMAKRHRTGVLIAGLLLAALAAEAHAKEKIKVGFIGPLTGGVSANGLGGRNSADLAVRLRNADAKAKYEYELVVLDD